MYWKVHFQIQNIEDLQKKMANPNIFDILYEPYELYPDARKRNQIELIKSVVFELKNDFNTEFAALEKLKEDQLFSI